jgi:hypothetical protein
MMKDYRAYTKRASFMESKPWRARHGMDTMDKECHEGQMINPLTGRCIKIRKAPNPSWSRVRTCVEGQMINPLTGRCIKVRVPVMKMKRTCVDGQMINPLTGRCIKIRKAPDPSWSRVRTCVDGQMINPLTGRCIKIRVPVMKICPPGKMINPLTGRCINEERRRYTKKAKKPLANNWMLNYIK